MLLFFWLFSAILNVSRRNIPGEPGKDYPIFSTNILCKINPRNPGCGAGGGSNGNRNKNGGGGGQKANNNGGQRRNNNAGSKKSPSSNGNSGSGNAARGNRNNADFQSQIAQGKIPGEAGKDYPVASLAAFRKRPGFENIELAPDHLITPDYPGLGKAAGGGGGRKKNSNAARCGYLILIV